MTQTHLPAISTPVQIDFLPDGKTPTVLSLQLAEHFEIKHQHVLRDIRAIMLKIPESFNASNFGRVEYLDPKGEKRPAYNLTRDGFTLLAMGYNSPKAIQWKIRYIEAFNALEAAVMENIRKEAHDAGFRAALDKVSLSCVVKDARRQAHAEGFNLALDKILTPDRIFLKMPDLEKMRKAAYYKKKDLTNLEISKLMDCSRSTVGIYLRLARMFNLEGV